ncbi:MAG: DegT/DnrJ/EryC1/StrS family aminotransferase [Desulfomicrobium escambiense]|nr:DegT/DnrJ/EryC1/StrS family aminotransferase [Desulfomicrobium escambiense]
MDPILAIAARAQAGRDRGRGAGARRRVQGPARRQHGRHGAASASTRARTWAPTAKAAWWSPTIPSTRATIRMLRDWGAEKKYQHVLKGYNYRLEGIQGAVLRRQAAPPRGLDRGAPRARRALRPSCLPAAASAYPARCRMTRHVYHIYAIRTADAPGAAWTRSPAQGIQTGIHYPIPVHLLPAYRGPRLRGRPVPALPSRPRARCCRCRCSPS